MTAHDQSRMDASKAVSTRRGQDLARGGGLSSARGLAAAYLLVLVLALAPLTLVDIPVLNDYTGHLARMHVIVSDGEDPLLNEKYVVEFRPVPDMAMDAIIPLLSRVMPLDVAGRVFIGLIIAVTLCGVALLNHALFGRWSWWPLCAGLFLYHGDLLAGMHNFSFSIGLMLVAAAVWIRLSEAPAWVRIPVGIGMSLLLYFSHVFGLVAYGLVAGGWELMRALRLPAERRVPSRLLREAAVFAVQFVIPVTWFLATTPLLGGEQELSLFGTWQNKLRGMFIPVANYNMALDVATWGTVAVLVAAGMVTRSLRFSPLLLPGFAGLGLLFLLLPPVIFSNGMVDHRFFVILTFLAVAGADVRIAAGRVRGAVAAGLALLFVARIGVVMANWSAFNEDVAEFRAAFGKVEAGSRVLVAFSVNDMYEIWRDGPARHFVLIDTPSLAHLPAIGVIERSVFIPQIFTHPGKHTLSVTEAYRHLDTNISVLGLPNLLAHLADVDLPNAEGKYWYRWWENFDYLLVLYPRYLQSVESVAADLLQLEFTGENVVVFRIENNRNKQ